MPLPVILTSVGYRATLTGAHFHLGQQKEDTRVLPCPVRAGHSGQLLF